MGTLLKVVGAIWTIIGVGNILFMPWTKSSEGILSFGLMFNVLLFVIPGLILFGIGAGITKKHMKKNNEFSTKTVSENQEQNIEVRLKKLKSLKEKGLVDEEDYKKRQDEILRDI